jgi:tetratricopeptide (TPR) repeat protein
MSPAIRAFCLISSLLLLGLPLCGQDESTNAVETTVTTVTAPSRTSDLSVDSQQILRSYLQLQEQLHSALLAIEQSRQESEQANKRSAEAVSARLKLIEQAITTQREREAESTRSANRMMVTVASVLGGIGLVAILLTLWFQFRAMNRLADIAGVLSPGHLMGHTPQSLLTAGESVPLASTRVDTASQRLLGAIDRLEKRVHELEHTGQAPGEERQGNGNANGNANGDAVADAIAIDSEELDAAQNASVLLGKGQALLNLGDAEKALECFDQILALQPDHPEALVKKGTALERLKRLEDAVRCYDHAIACDHTMTLAYLCKGGVFNQLERFSEALECYEQALRTQHKPTAA